MNLSKTRVVIVGAGQAGGRAAEALRAAGHAGPITLIGEEAYLPYERPQQTPQGIEVNTSGATAIDGVDAAGDVAEQWSRCHDRWMRLENWANAQNQAVATAKNMAGEAVTYEAPPWFWSDQYDANIQIVGHSGGGDEIVGGEIANGRFTTLSMLRRLVASRKTVRRSDLENPDFELKRSLAP